MSNQILDIPAQQNVIPKALAREYISNWKDIIGLLYAKKENENMPHGFFVPFEDIMELYKLQKEVTHLQKEDGTLERIYIIGIRAYYCIKDKLDLPIPITSAAMPVAGLLVAVYQKNPRIPGMDEYRHFPEHDNFDLIVGVPSVNDKSVPGDADDYSIYDVTRPCPNLCDTDSMLYKEL